MKNIFKIVVLLCTLLNPIKAAIIVKGNMTTSPYAFNSIVSTRALDEATGNFYVGLSGSSDKFNISKALRYTSITTPQFVGIAPSTVQGEVINFLALSPLADSAARITGSSEHAFNQIFSMLNDGTSFSESGELNDAQTTGKSAHRVVGLAASAYHVVAAVTPHKEVADDPTPFGTENSGLALVSISSNIVLTIKDATTGFNGNRAQALDSSSAQLTLGTNDVIFIENGDEDDNSKKVIPQLIYDRALDRFYCGMSMQPGSNNGDKALSITMAHPDSDNSNQLTIQEIMPAIITAAGDSDKIIFAENDGASTLNLYVKKLGVLHASTGPSYLIVSGGSTSGNNTETGNTVYALPLVDDPSDDTIHGTIANKNSNLTDGKFTNAADDASEIPLITDVAAIVGRVALPIESDRCISDMVVLGDTVYVSTIEEADNDNEPGIFYSQALFDKTGKISCWTPWTKKLLPSNAFPEYILPGGAIHNGQVALFQVDLVNGKIWFVEGITKQAVGITSWNSPKNITSDTPLVEQLNKTFKNGLYCALDLDQSTRGICDEILARYALFGGTGSIAFVRTSIAASTSLNATQTVPTDFSTADNFQLTELPHGSGCCQALEFSRRTQDDNSLEKYFFVGTDKGLFVFAQANGDGFDNTDISGLPFNGQWHQISVITGSVTAIKTTGNTLYILTQNMNNTLQSTVYRVDFDTNISSMFASPIIIAQTGSGSFADVQLFYDISIIAVDNVGNEEQVVLATNSGLYQTGKSGGAQDATDDTDAAWQVITQGFFNGIAEPDNTPRGATSCPPIPARTVWPFSITDPDSLKIFNHGKIFQLNRPVLDTDPAVLDPVPFNTQTTIAGLSNLDPILSFYSDGARRFFIINRQSDPCTSRNLIVLPFDSTTWNISTQAQTLISDPQLQNIDTIFWMGYIGATGSFLIGTDSGVYSLD